MILSVIKAEKPEIIIYMKLKPDSFRGFLLIVMYFSVFNWCSLLKKLYSTHQIATDEITVHF